MFSAFRRWRRQQIAANFAVDDAAWQQVEARLAFLDFLEPAERARLRVLTLEFLAEKQIAGAGGLEVDNAMRLAIGLQACLPILNIGLGAYGDWVGIIVYPEEFIIPRVVEDEFGVVHEYDDIASGEAWDGGPLLISWHDAQMAGAGYNVVIHEFAHKLDMLNGEANGIPPLPASVSRKTWEATLLEAYEDFCALVEEAAERAEDTLLDPYAAESPGEFFAVMSETFFETPDILSEEYPALYAQMSLFYRQDPAARGR